MAKQKKKPTPIYFTEEQKDYLSALSDKSGYSMTSIIGRLVDNEIFKDAGNESESRRLRN